MLATDFLHINRNADYMKHLLSLDGVNVFFVGGIVRDSILGTQSKDCDIVVSGVPMSDVISELQPFGKVDIASKHIGVIKLTVTDWEKYGEGQVVDVCLPRTEKSDDTPNYQGFEFNVDHTLDIREDLKRRDLTFNAMAIDVRDGHLIDPFNGVLDIENKVVKMTSVEMLQEDASRMLRVIESSVRFGFEIDTKTLKAIRFNCHLITSISGEVLHQIFLKFYKRGDVVKAKKLLIECGLYKELFSTYYGMPEVPITNEIDFWFYMLSGTKNFPHELYKNVLKGNNDMYNSLKAIIEFNMKLDSVAVGPLQLKHLIREILKLKIGKEVLTTSKYLVPVFNNTYQEMLSNNLPVTIKDLAVNGRDLMEVGITGKAIKETQIKLLELIWSNKLINSKKDLLSIF